MVAAPPAIFPNTDMAGLGCGHTDATEHLIAERFRQRPPWCLEYDIEARHPFEGLIAVKMHVPSAGTRLHVNVIEQHDDAAIGLGINKTAAAPRRLHRRTISTEPPILTHRQFRLQEKPERNGSRIGVTKVK